MLVHLNTAKDGQGICWESAFFSSQFQARRCATRSTPEEAVQEFERVLDSQFSQIADKLAEGGRAVIELPNGKRMVLCLVPTEEHYDSSMDCGAATFARD